ncbi:Diacylglycerol acyltransferase/mycolyltransferase Ag85C precursor [Corynebacterium choanae]|uniref:Diacylglycerol acyltransferase/mycolyltransferase Ag85C n=2 Tax=Corynebacterium choanae TaxID=1862358 RepID=A0A3G6J3Q0_9CORY|nr:Diacylglycerol acyltransferase/mycolyltransferase Ag85C precursor [Corynebacterium choanae]
MFARARTVGKRFALAALSVVTAGSLSLAGVTDAQAQGNREWLRPDATGTCEWSQVQHWVQRCDVFSPAMGRTIPVLVQPSKAGGNAGLYLLDGMRAEDNQSGWALYTDAAALYEDSNINVIMPIGGAGSFYTDWEAPATYLSSESAENALSSSLSGSVGSSAPHAPIVYKWETFLTAELPGYLQQHFGVDPQRNTIAGISMGGTAAMNLAARHPGQFKQAMSFSGYLTMTAPGMQSLLRGALLASGGYNVNSMYGTVLSPRRFENDPYWNMEGLRNTDVYVSAASGFPAPYDQGLPAFNKVVGFSLEQVARSSTAAWEIKARAIGLNPTVDYMPAGVHNWGIWQDQLHKTKARVLNFHNAW